MSFTHELCQLIQPELRAYAKKKVEQQLKKAAKNMRDRGYSIYEITQILECSEIEVKKLL